MKKRLLLPVLGLAFLAASCTYSSRSCATYGKAPIQKINAETDAMDKLDV